jgi:hypothetical protein
VVISNLKTVEAVRDTYLDIRNGVINATPRPGRLLIEASTIGPSTARELSVDLAENGAASMSTLLSRYEALHPWETLLLDSSTDPSFLPYRVDPQEHPAVPSPQ